MDALKTRLNTWLRDSANLTFTDAEKTEILTEAINDPYVLAAQRDSSLTTADGVNSYTLPDNLGAIYDIGLDVNGDGIMTPLPSELYDMVDGTLYFNTAMPTGKTILIDGRVKLTVDDDIPDNLAEYVLHLGMVSAFEMLKTSLTTRFVKNDMTMTDLINSANTHRQRANELRHNLINQRLVTL